MEYPEVTQECVDNSRNETYDRLPTQPQLEDNHHISIEQGLVGAALRVGCQVLYLSDEKEALKYLAVYFEDKIKWIKAYSNGTLKELIKEVK